MKVEESEGGRQGGGQAGGRAGSTKEPKPATHHSSQVSSASATTAGTNTAETLSAKAWMGALLSCADSTRRTICASAVSAPTLQGEQERGTQRACHERCRGSFLGLQPVTDCDYSVSVFPAGVAGAG